MSKADEMFEKLGYEKIEYNQNEIFHIEYEMKRYDFWQHKTIIIQFWDDKTFNKTNGFDEVEFISMQELQAINEKCKELGWIE